MLAFSNKDVSDLNVKTRHLLKQSGHIEKEEFLYRTQKDIEDDFGRITTLSEEKIFSQGDRIVFTRNEYGLGVKNGTIGTITKLDKNTIHLTLDEGISLKDKASQKDISFAPNLMPYFDHGWAITIHKSQGTTVSQTYVLTSYEMNQNLAYVAMTRHQDSVHIFGSSLDFWRPEKLPEVLAKSGEKLSAADYLDAESLHKLMSQDDKLLTKLFTRLSNELEAMGAVSKAAFQKVADHFLGIQRDKEIRAPIPTHQSVREEARAEILLNQWRNTKDFSLPFSVEQEEERRETRKEALYRANMTQKSFPQSPTPHQPFIDAKAVEAALIQNMTSFADDIFSSIGEPLHQPSSSSAERRYGKKGHISVNLKTGAWIDYKDSDKCGGPLHLLTKLKGLSYEEAIHQGAKWAGLSSTSSKSLSNKQNPFASRAINAQHTQENKTLTSEQKEKIQKAQAMWAKGRPIQGTLAERYLKDHRKIRGSLPKDLRYLPEFRDKESGRKYPCLMAGARSPAGDISAVQLTFLNPKNARKADIVVQKKSFGVIKGSSVTIQEDKTSKVLFIAEGIETALSIKEAGFKGAIKASLGLSNMQHLARDTRGSLGHDNGTFHIIICADHDHPKSSAAKNLRKLVHGLSTTNFQKNLQVTLVKPDRLKQDFNDVLKEKGHQGVKHVINKSLPHDLWQVVQHDASLHAPRRCDKNISLARFEDNLHKAAHAHAEHQQRLAFEEKTRQMEREMMQARERARDRDHDLSL